MLTNSRFVKTPCHRRTIRLARIESTQCDVHDLSPCSAVGCRPVHAGMWRR